VLDLAKVESGKMEFRPEAIDLERVMSEVGAILRTTSATKGVRIEMTIDPAVRKLTLDPARLKQVLYNYLSNALKFSTQGGTVAVRARPETDDLFRLEVIDSGIGIADSDLPRLFTEFSQLDTGSGKRHGGTGLGLALTKRLVTAQGGLVGVESTPGKGSTFYAILPRHARQSAPAPTPPPPQVRPKTPLVLVVEDDARDRETIVRTLVDAGYSVEAVMNGTEAIARCRTQRYDAITLDLILPDTSGLDVLRALREDGPNLKTPVVVVSVVAERATAGFVVHEVLAKPIDAGHLLASLARAGLDPTRNDTVLVVDDDPGSLKLMAATLAQIGFRSICCNGGSAGLRALEDERPAAVIVDLLMPEMSGFEFLERFRQLDEAAQVPLFVWTIKDLSSDERARLRRSAQAILQKGTGSSELIAALRTQLGGSEVPAG
jgi:CheY-like chemotaxis protein